MTGTLTVKVAGVGAMLRGWLRLRRVFRAKWHKGRMVIYRPFVVPAYRVQRGKTTTMDTRDLLARLYEGGKDDLDLFLHESWWHGVMGQRIHAKGGLGSNDMAERAETTSDSQRVEAMVAVANRWETVEVVG